MPTSINLYQHIHTYASIHIARAHQSVSVFDSHAKSVHLIINAQQTHEKLFLVNNLTIQYRFCVVVRQKQFCLTSIETRMFIRDGDKGEGDEVNSDTVDNSKERRLNRRRQPKTKDAVERRQNNKMLIRQCPLRHCAATSVPRSYCPNCCAEQSHKDNVCSSTVGNNWCKRSPTSEPSSTSYC